MNEFWDEDIAATRLGQEEKTGLQVFRNYKNAFDKRASEKFAEEVNLETFDLTSLDRILSLIVKEDLRFLTVFFCSFADEQLEGMFKREIPESVPSGRSSMLGGFGGLSRFSQRIQSAYAFNWMTADILLELDKIRKIRNEFSHSWDVELLKTKLNLLVDEQMHQLEKHLGDGVHLPPNFWNSLSQDSVFRIRLIWLSGRCYYESRLYPQAVKRRLDVFQTLYGIHKPQLLADVSKKCLRATNDVIANDDSKHSGD